MACKPWITQASEEFHLGESLIAAVMWQESNFDKNAKRYEPDFFDKYILRMEFAEVKTRYPKLGAGAVNLRSEKISLATSWGLMQVMGQTARELGFRGNPRELLGYEGVRFGCIYLKVKLDKYQHDIDSALSAYNAGTPTSKNRESYVLEVKKRREIMRGEF